MLQSHIDVQNKYYQNSLDQREFYQEFYPYIKSAFDIIDNLENKIIFSQTDQIQFIKAKTIIDFVAKEMGVKYNLGERVSQTPLSSLLGDIPEWKKDDYQFHYNEKNGAAVTLKEIGALQAVFNRAENTVNLDMQKMIVERVPLLGVGIHPFNENGSYRLHSIIGRADVTSKGNLDIKEIGRFWSVEVSLKYEFYSRLTNPPGILNFGGTPFDITGEWTTKLEAFIEKR